MRSAAAFVLAAALALPAAVRAERVHVVKPGETLWSIAARLTGDASLWRALFRANRDQIGDPSLLYPGQRLAIPDLGARGDAGAPPGPAPHIR